RFRPWCCHGVRRRHLVEVPWSVTGEVRMCWRCEAADTVTTSVCPVPSLRTKRLAPGSWVGCRLFDGFHGGLGACVQGRRDGGDAGGVRCDILTFGADDVAE